MATTTQLRHYHPDPEVWEEWLAWWHDVLMPAREAFGFSLVYAYVVPERHGFEWAVSLPVDRAAFEAKDREWETSPTRLAAIASVPRPVLPATWTEIAEPFAY